MYQNRPQYSANYLSRQFERTYKEFGTMAASYWQGPYLVQNA